MLEHSAMYMNVPQYEDDTSFFPDFYTRLGPCELQDPVWAKMSALATGVNKKRKKSETKPQAQINKCNNEKRRREQENIYIEELAELISANFADMSSLSVKPDKCAILQETVNQIRSIKQREAAQSSDPVQQGEVSSSRPTILSNEVYGPLLLEALEGFLFVINTDGRVEHITDNVATYIKFSRDDILGKSIYNYIHLGDHTRFSANVMPTTIGWPGEQTNRSRSCSVRFLVKPPDVEEETVEEKQQRVNCYELMHISSTQLRDQVTVSEDEGCADSGPLLLCVASRISHRDKATAGIEQFTTKLDTSGKIIGVDVSGVSPQYSQFINKDLLKDRLLRSLVPQQEVHKLNAHLRDTVNVGQSTSVVYRLQIGQDKFVQVQTKSKFFKTNPHATTDTDFIMATHSIVGEYDTIGPTDPGGGTSSVGGPLMTSVVNGTRNGTAPVSSGSDSSTASSNATLMNTGNTFTNYSLDNEFLFDILPSSTFDLEPSTWPEPRPDSRQSATPVSTPTPRPPSNPAYSPAATVAQSPLATAFGTSPSTPAPNPYNATAFSFSPLSEQNYEEKDTKANVLEEASTMMADSGRLRNLLTKPPNAADSSAADADGRNKNRILKGLLNQQDEDDNRSDNRASPRGLINRGPVPGPSELPKTSTAGGNNMLLQLLNERSDDDDHVEAKAGIKKKSELLQQLLKPESRENEDEKKSEAQSHEDSLLRSLGFTSSPSPPSGETGRNRKRPSDDRDDPSSTKRSSDGSQLLQVSSTGAAPGSRLFEKNPRLASLLAKQPNNEQPIPHIPVSILSATPQDILPRISIAENKTTKPMATRSTTAVSQQRTVVKNTLENMSRMQQRQPTNYLTTMLTHPNNIHHQRNDSRQMNQVDSGSYTSPATSSTDGNIDNPVWGDNNNVHSNDPLLSDILDQVMDIVPDEVERVFAHAEGQQSNNFQNEQLSEKMAINIIQKSLMQCESVVKSPSSPTISLPGTPPAYSPSTMTTQNSQMRSFPPPPNYHQTSFIAKRLQVRQGAPQYPAGAIANQQLLLQRKQQEDRRRLLEQQQQQQLLIPSNATAAEINSGLQNIDSLLNNTVAPNVSLQRSASLPESQLSPSYGVNQQNQRLNSQQPYSPHSQLVSPQGFPQTSAANYQQARLSPQFNQQMALRQAYPQGAQGQNWQQNQARLSLQNPMLNAQLTRAPTQQAQQQQQQQQQQQRSLNSPGTVTSRHSPYPQDSFPPPTSPNSAAFNQSQYLRLQRANSVPTATTQLPGGLGSPRPYGREHHPHPYPPIPNPHQHPMMYQQDSSQYCYDQTGLQLAYNGADRGRAPPHLQAGVSGSGPTSEFVRQELRAVVGARTGQAQTAPNRNQNQLLNQQQVDLEALGITFEMPTTGASDSPKLWCAMGSDMGSMSPQPATSRSSMEEARPGDHNKSSLLQKLLSE